MIRRYITRIAAGASVAALVLSLGASTVLGGEITGNGKSLEPLHARSICAYSGLNDEITPEEPGRVQSYGQFVRVGLKEFLDGLGLSPGNACNPTRGFEE